MKTPQQQIDELVEKVANKVARLHYGVPENELTVMEWQYCLNNAKQILFNNKLAIIYLENATDIDNQYLGKLCLIKQEDIIPLKEMEEHEYEPTELELSERDEHGFDKS